MIAAIRTGLAGLCLFQLQSQPASRPNAPPRRPGFVFILGEGHGWSSTSVAMDGGRGQQPAGLTPNLERLAREGMRWSQFYVSAPRCTPSRASLLTGIGAAQLHMTYVNEGGANRREPVTADQRLRPPSPTSELPAGVRTTGDWLREAGYATAHFGKWHVGRTDPTRHGFDQADGANTNRGPQRDAEPNPEQARAITDLGIAFVRAQVQAGRPFFLQLSHYGVGTVDEVTPEALAAAQALLPRATGRPLVSAAGMRDMDTQIGRLLQALQELGIADCTYVLFSTDHGTPGGGGGGGRNVRGGGANSPLAGGKGSVQEGGVRVPFLVRGPGIAPGSVCAVRGIGMDLLPTLRELAGRPLSVPTAAGRFALEGGSLAPLLLGHGAGTVARPRPELVIHFPHYDLGNGGPASALYLGDWKLVRNDDSGRVSLFDVVHDPGETQDLAGQNPGRVGEFLTRLDNYLDAVGAQRAVPRTPAAAASQPASQPARRKR